MVARRWKLEEPVDPLSVGLQNAMPDQPLIPDEQVATLIDPDLRREIGDPVPVKFAATVVYLPLLLLGVGTSAFWLKTVPGPNLNLRTIAIDLSAGTGTALVLVIVTYLLAKYVKPFHELGREFSNVLGTMSTREVLQIGALSGAAEELVFRGTMQPWLAGHMGTGSAIAVTSVVFGLLHFVPYRVFFPLTGFATVVGLICGALFEMNHTIVAPMVAHVLLNAINLWLLVSTRTPDRTTPRPSAG